MEPLVRQVRKAQRRLAFQKFVLLVAWCWFAALVVAAGLVAADKYWPQGPIATASGQVLQATGLSDRVVPELRAGVWPLAGLLLGGLVALVWTYIFRRGALDAAIEIDRRFGLKERVSSTLSLSPVELETDAGRALVADAVRRVEQVEIGERFGVSFSRWSWLPLAPAVAAFLFAFFLPEATQPDTPSAQAASPEQQQKIKKQTRSLQRSLADRRREAREKGLPEAEELFQRLERETGDMARAEQQDRKNALVQLNNLADDLERRRQDLASSDKIRQQLNELRPSSSGPADKLSKALREGDLKQAMQQIEDLKRQLDEGKLDKASRDQLQQQLAEMRDKLQGAADEHRDAKQALQEQIDQLRQSGQKADAERLQQQLDKLAQNDEQMRRLEQLAQQMGKCAKCMQEGNDAEAAQGMEGMKADLEALQQELEEMQMLDEALDEIAQTKQGLGQDMDSDGQGNGLGEGRGEGDRPIEESDGQFYDSKVKQKPDGGTGVVTGVADGPNVRGDVEAQIQAEIAAAATDESDPLTGQPLPREYRDHAKGYFDMLRVGETAGDPEGGEGDEAEPEEGGDGDEAEDDAG